MYLLMKGFTQKGLISLLCEICLFCRILLNLYIWTCFDMKVFFFLVFFISLPMKSYSFDMEFVVLRFFSPTFLSRFFFINGAQKKAKKKSRNDILHIKTSPYVKISRDSKK